MYKKSYILSIALFAIHAVSWAEVRLPNIFGDHMVLQRDKPIPVWGWADPGEKVSVVLTHANSDSKPLTVKAGKDGKWRVDLPATAAGGPFQLVVKGKKNEVTLSDVLVGEVWICSGQSNMAWTVNASNNPDVEKANANYPAIRHITVPREMSMTPEEDIKKKPWLVTSPETVGDFSAVAYFFARELYKELNVPIGLINTSWGGTQVESWISREGMGSFDEFREVTANLPASVDELQEKWKKVLLDRIKNAQGELPSASVAAQFSGAGFDDSSWKTMKLPQFFDSRELPAFDGVIWFRKSVDAGSLDASKPVILSLGVLDDIEEVFVNGTKVGETKEKSSSPRFYIVPAGTLRSGNNHIAIRVQDKEGRGGFKGNGDEMLLIQGTTQVSLAGDWKYRVEEVFDNKQFAGPNHAATLLYNSMIAPLVPYGIKGAIWYQGESNAGRAVQYRQSFPLMITDWRHKWGEEFPFLFVQLASFKASDGTSATGSTWAELREAQTMTLKLPKTGMAVIHDIGERDDIHPRNKQDVGKRLALSAYKTVYNKDLVYSGPVYSEMKQEGNAVSVTFDHVGGGLVVKGDKYGYLKGFEVAGADRKFYPAKAEISGNKVVVWSDEVTNPVAVRYGWADDNIEANLFNAEGLPADSFRTDNWPEATKDAKFK